MKKLLFLLPVLALFTLCGCSKSVGDPVTKEFSISGGYSELEVEDAFDVTVSDAVSQVTITAGDRIMSKIKVEKIGNKLKLSVKGWNFNRGTMTAIIPYSADLKQIDLSGACDFHSPFALTGENVEIEISGASDFFGRVEATELELDLSGASNATIDGVVSKLDLSLSGASDLCRKIVGTSYSLSCNECECSISGSSDAYLHCDGSINGSISGSSSLHFTGTAFTADCSVSGSSEIVHDVL